MPSLVAIRSLARPFADRPALRRRLFVAAATTALLAGTVWVHGSLRAREQAAMLRDLQSAAQQSVHLLHTKIERSTEVLQGIASLFELRPSVQRQDFSAFVRRSLAGQQEVAALEWIPRVPEVERGTFEQGARDEGLEGFQFTEKRADQLVRAEARDEYFPVLFVEPLDGNEEALGFDLAANVERRRALEQARDSGEPVASQPVRLAQEKAEQLGVLVFQPVYRAMPRHPTVSDRREALLGFALAVFRIGDLVGGTLTALAGRGLEVTISDGLANQLLVAASANGPPGGWLRHGAIGEPGAGPRGSVRVEETLEVVGRRWVFRLAPTAAFASGQRQGNAGWVLVGGLLLTALAAGYLSSSLKRRTEVEAANRALQAEIAVRKRAEEHAGAASRAKTTFLANMSHEIRTPLNAILGYAQILEREPQLPAPLREAVDTIGASGRHLLGLVNEILDLGKIEDGRQELRESDFDLGALLLEIASLFEHRCREKRLGFRLQGTVGRAVVRGDLIKLRQVLINLVGNAVKFTESGEVVLEVQLDPTSPDRRVFKVIDTGPGISPELQEEVFAAFRQGSHRARGGTGLGLAIARAHVALMGGTLSLQSTPGRGSCFWFELPLRAMDVTAPAPVEGGGARTPGFPLRALVVDDVRENRRVLASMLETLGCRVEQASDGGQALERVEALLAPAGVCVVFLDVGLPDEDGRLVARRMRERGGSLHLVAHSASAFDHQRDDYLRSGFDDFLAKPVSWQSLQACLRAVPGVDLPPDDLGATPEPSGDVLRLPDELRLRLLDAARVHSATELRRGLRELERLAPRGAPLLDEITQALRRYDMDAVLAALEARA
jgi:signal transduction histidine kinase/CheY-like chemotaxis protein